MMIGRPLLQRIEAQTLDEPIPPALDILAADFAAHNHDLRRLILLIASTEVFRLDSAASFEITDEHEESWAVFPLSRLRPEQVIGNVIQAASVKTIDQRSHVFTRLMRYFNEKDFVQALRRRGRRRVRESPRHDPAAPADDERRPRGREGEGRVAERLDADRDVRARRRGRGRDCLSHRADAPTDREGIRTLRRETRRHERRRAQAPPRGPVLDAVQQPEMSWNH